jgi:hypothetical protein
MPMDRPIARVSRGLSAYRAFSPRRADLGRGAESGQSRRSVVTFPPGEADAGSGDLADHSNRRSSLYVRADPQEAPDSIHPADSLFYFPCSPRLRRPSPWHGDGI